MSADGLSADGLSADGLSADGLSADGLSADGLSADGLSADGLSADGLSADGLLEDLMDFDLVGNLSTIFSLRVLRVLRVLSWDSSFFLVPFFTLFLLQYPYVFNVPLSVTEVAQISPLSVSVQVLCSFH
jgi:hypothetical protein